MPKEPQDLHLYSKEELEQLSEYSHAVKKYLRLLNSESNLPTLFKKRLSDWCRASAASFFNKSTSEEVCYFWSNSADQILKDSWAQFGLSKYPIALFAMGKLGGQELNLSSDVDLLIISEKPVDLEIEKAVKDWIRFLSKTTEFGFLFRVDMDLRPGGRFAQLVPSLFQTEDHYWGHGETWERLAMIRLRPLTGHQYVIDEMLALRQSFCFRKYLDYSLFADFRMLRQSIFEFKKVAREGIELKLSPGGIRDIELLTHSLQLIHGGRLKDIQSHKLTPTIQQLHSHNILNEKEAKDLIKHYWGLRHLENLSQAKEDRQTHKSDQLNIQKDLLAMNEFINTKLGEPIASSKLPQNLEGQFAWLSDLGFNMTKSKSTWLKIQDSVLLARRAQSQKIYRDSVIKDFIESLSEGLNPDNGLSYFADFIYASRAKSSLFTVLSQAPTLVRDLAQLFSTSNYASSIVTSRPELIDSLFLQQTSQSSADIGECIENLLDKKFITQVGLGLNFLKAPNVSALTSDLSLLADQLVGELATEIKKEYPSDLEILKLGKWGRLEFSFKSDLDFVFVSPDALTENDVRFAKRLVSHLTEAHRGGSLYGLDLRLRPNGAAGPLITSQKSLFDFISNKSDAWQRQSYLITRGSTLNTSQQLQRLIFEKGFDEQDFISLKAIRKQLRQKAGSNDLKYSPGGLIDIEYAVQIALIQSKTTCTSTSDGLTQLFGNNNTVLSNYFYFRNIELLMQFILNQGGSALRQSTWESAELEKLLKKDWATFTSDLQRRFAENELHLKDLDPALRD